MNQPSSSSTATRRIPRIWAGAAGIVIAALVLSQLVRFVIPDLRLDNPPVTQQVVWDTPETQQLWTQACADCHSNQTVYPWYAYVAPVGWLVAHDTHEGRDALNVSEDRRVEWDEMVEVIEAGEMPPPIYRTMHPQANLNDAQRQALMAGIRATFR